MPRTGKDLTGERFGKLIVDGFAGYGQKGRQRVSMWECRCDCGEEKSVSARDLKNRRVTSCGCDRTNNQTDSDFQEYPFQEGMEEKCLSLQKGDTSEIHTLSEWVYVWLKVVLPNVVKASTIQMYAETMGHHILSSLGSMKLEDITEQTVQDWVKKLQSTSVPGTRNGYMTDGTVRNTLSVLSGCMRDAQKYGLIGRNPCIESAWTLKSKNVGEHQEWLSEDQVTQLEPLLAAYQDEDGYPLGLGFQLMLYTGITLSEAAALRWRDVDLAEEKLSLHYFVAIKWEQNGGEADRRQELEKLPGRKCREVPVPGSLIHRLDQVKREYAPKPDDFVLCRSDREPVRMDRMRATLMRRGNSCGIGTVTPRMIRDTYAMRAVHAGATSDTIAELMGFASSQQVIRRYMPKTVTDKRELIKKMFGK